MTNVVVDTNVFLYALDEDSAYHQRCKTLLSSSEVALHTTSKSVSECVAMMTKLNVEKSEIERTLEDVSKDLVILYPSPLSLPLFKRLFSKYEPRGNRVFDIEIVSIMLAAGITQLATINTKDFRGIDEISLYAF